MGKVLTVPDLEPHARLHARLISLTESLLVHLCYLSLFIPFDFCSRPPSPCIKRDLPYAFVLSLTLVPVSPFFHLLSFPCDVL
jgi:hypothetical protein